MATKNDELARRLQKVKDRHAAAEREKDRAAGGLETVMQRLKKEFGCDSLADAEKLMRRFDRQAEAAGKEFEEALAAFEEQHPMNTED